VEKIHVDVTVFSVLEVIFIISIAGHVSFQISLLARHVTSWLDIITVSTINLMTLITIVYI